MVKKKKFVFGTSAFTPTGVGTEQFVDGDAEAWSVSEISLWSCSALSLTLLFLPYQIASAVSLHVELCCACHRCEPLCRLAQTVCQVC